MLEHRLEDPNYKSLTKSSKRKDDVSITDAKVDTDSDNDIINDNDNNTLNKKVTWNEHGFQSAYSDINGLHQIKYGDDDHKIDISD